MDQQPQSRLVNTKPTAPRQVTYTPSAPLTVSDKDPNKAYRWIKLDGRTFIGGTDLRGWELDRRGDGNDETLTGSVSQFSPRALGSIRRLNGLALASMPKELAAARNEAFKKKADMQVRSQVDVQKHLKQAQGNGKKIKIFGSVERG